MKEEAEQVTKQLKKLWVNYGESKGELDGAWGEWAAEKEDMLDSVRMLQQQLTLKDLVIQAFVPPEDVQKVHRLPLSLHTACCTHDSAMPLPFPKCHCVPRMSLSFWSFVVCVDVGMRHCHY